MQQSHFIPYRNGRLHIRHIKANPSLAKGMPILMLHGAMSNGRVFYSASGKGLGCYLARQGFDVYILDTAGRGLSEPKISAAYSLGQTEVILEQLPLANEFILSHSSASKVHWCAHSWGGVLMASCYVRLAKVRTQVASFVTFGSKRTIKIKSLRKTMMVDLFWNRLAPFLSKVDGYLAADKYRMGMDNESRQSLRQTIDWVKGDWVDCHDNFDYAAAARQVTWPPCWFLAAKKDRVLGNPSDVQDMMGECQMVAAEYTLLAKHRGFKRDYTHAGMLTDKSAVDDHFPLVKSWYDSLAK
ncbi:MULTISPECIES: alpha/beta fold hydrolase [unclassified Shewanella]|uniref:alpha/beta fold hydrolase n=1 Tax=unclassified Shewanella TaxID=196818 RepID=UPI000C85DE9A|nr:MULTISPECIES: alpha/beta fold hydrolase [unclassified Shewanella]MDO6620409.1 alpha/beta fold hydrolase [Shewanella sp. 6_MG-2023]MDO6640073.1 alpha/beta fold hydrolase [Shewanella sp. 5_MG-2023]MDO6774991.1 alpha/beta fold hydrolase [Shewanella sp. 3_MG-2023]PMG26969.1 alpha/beta hydrolase [Shewanella sp. 10N.286.52.C2]PMG40319.1 alpha/beta hydrolase [Shewanella sp. 10N.286.52.B9]